MNTTRQTDSWTTFDELRAQWEAEYEVTAQLRAGHDSLRAHAIVALMLLPLIGMLGAAGQQLSATIGASVFAALIVASIGVHVWLVEYHRPRMIRARLSPAAPAAPAPAATK